MVQPTLLLTLSTPILFMVLVALLVIIRKNNNSESKRVKEDISKIKEQINSPKG